MKRIYYWGILLIIIALSFALYSSRFYALFNSDDALNVLMAHSYSLPDNFYCWGQDRGGTLVPLVALLFKFIGFNDVMAVSLANYLILFVGFICFSSLLRSDFYKIVFAVIWFLPSQRFVDLTRFPLGVEYSLLALAIFLINKYVRSRNIWLMIPIVATLIVSVWVSDLALVSIGVLVLVLLVYNVLRNKKLILDKKATIVAVAGAAVCYGFIRIAKSHAWVHKEGYLHLNGLSSMWQSISMFFRSVSDILLFKQGDLLVGVYSWLALAFVVLFVVTVIRSKYVKDLFADKWIAFFMLDFVAIMSVYAVSSWVLSNGMGRWYFVAPYISFSLFVILCLDRMPIGELTKFRVPIAVVVIVGALSPVYSMRHVYPKTLRPRIDIALELKQLSDKPIGIVAEYWNSYVNAAADPDFIVATPHQNSDVRNESLSDKVFECDNVFIIRDMWFDSFPDRMEQFGRVLIKSGDEFRIAGSNVCRYSVGE